MVNCPFRFIHAADFHLERPPFGVSEVPDHLRELFLEASFWAAERVFGAVLSEQAEFLVLSGDLLDPLLTGPRGPLFLIEQFQRLAEQNVIVYWAGGRVDPPEAWPAELELPENVQRFGRRRGEEFVYYRDSRPLARLIGSSRTRTRAIRPGDFDPDPTGLFTIAVVHGSAKAETLKARGIDYWALGGSHTRQTLYNSPHLAHYPGSPQGRHPADSGPHGCTLVEVDSQGHAQATLLPCDVIRWQNERIVVDEATTREGLESLLHQRMQTVLESVSGVDVLITWTVGGSGPLVAEVRRGALRAELVAELRKNYGFGPPAAWSVSLEAEAAAVLPAEWYEQQTILGDFLREIRRYQVNPDEPLELESFLSDQRHAGSFAAAARMSDKRVRERVLREAAMLAVDLLSGEGPLS